MDTMTVSTDGLLCFEEVGMRRGPLKMPILQPPRGLDDKTFTIVLDGHVIDELSAARDGEGIGVSSAYLLLDGTDEIGLRDERTDLLDAEGRFSISIEIKAIEGAEYTVELHAADTNPEDPGGPNSGPVDSTYIRVPHDDDDD
jgi:hypothetical protein